MVFGPVVFGPVVLVGVLRASMLSILDDPVSELTTGSKLQHPGLPRVSVDLPGISGIQQLLETARALSVDLILNLSTHGLLEDRLLYRT